MKAMIYAAAACVLIAGCATANDEFKQTRLADGGTELALPYSPANAAWEGAGLPFEAILNERAKALCPDRDYRIEYQGVRQRPEYEHSERVWVVRCQ